jgi:predicted HicB family RNase H-like nuclease
LIPVADPAPLTRFTVGPDVDLEREDIRLKDGTRLTNEVVDEIVQEVRRATGRPSLTGKREASPQIAFRVTPSARARAAEVAAREGKTVSQLAREALEERIARTG